MSRAKKKTNKKKKAKSKKAKSNSKKSKASSKKKKVKEDEELLAAESENEVAEDLVDTGESTKEEELTEASEMELSDQGLEELPDAEDEELTAEELEAQADSEEEATDSSVTEGTELEAFESADIEDKEYLDEAKVISILESILFATDRPQSLAIIRQAFKGTNIKTPEIRKALKELSELYADEGRGITVEEVNGGYQLRSKVDNMTYLRRMIKSKTFRLSGPALEVLSIVAYNQPCIKSDVDEIRGVESGHLLRGLMERGLVCFDGKSDFPGKPMLYGTTRKFLEIFGLRNLKELPSLGEIDELIPEGIGEVEEKESTLDELTGELSKEVGSTYSEGEDELLKITDQLQDISTSTDFFEQEKQRQKEKKQADRAQDIREALTVGEDVSNRDKKWLERYEAEQAEKTQTELEKTSDEEQVTVPEGETSPGESNMSLELKEEEASGEVVDLNMSPDMEESEELTQPEDEGSDESVELGSSEASESALLAKMQMKALEDFDSEEETEFDSANISVAEGEVSNLDEAEAIQKIDFEKLGKDLEVFDEEPPEDSGDPSPEL